MKKKMFLPAFVLFAMCFTACRKSISNNNQHAMIEEIQSLRIIPPKRTSQTLIDSTGLIHNHVLEKLYANAGAYQTHESFAGYLSAGSDKLLVTDFGFAPLPATFNDEISADVVKLMSNDYYLLQKPQMDSIMNETINALIEHHLTNSMEENLLDQAGHIFDLDPATPDAAAYDSIIARANRLLIVYNSYNWREGEGNAVGGFLNIARSSAQFWKNRNLVSPPSKLPWWIRGWGLPQFDAAGYIAGWGKAWLWDELETAKKRIGAGLSMAANWSGISGYFK